MIKLKNNDEINKIRDSCKILAETFKELSKIIQEGITTLQINGFVEDYIKKRGGKPAFLNYNGYPASICTSINSVVIHGIPDKTKLKNGDIISLDLGVDLKGFISDSALTLPVGEITKEAAKLKRVTKEALFLGIEKAVSGNRIKDISTAVFSHATKYKYGVVHQFCGHGVGFALHEDPQIPNYIGSGKNPRLKAGMVIAIEPMLNIGTGDVEILDDGWTVETADKKLSAHFEHTIAIFPDYTEILTILD